MRAIRILILLLFVPTALMPVRLDVCLDCLFGDEVCCERADQGCCRGREAAEAPAATSCCSGPALRAPGRGDEELGRTDPAPRDCCLHIDNDRDELPPSSQAYELPSLLCRLALTTIQPEAPPLAAARPEVAPDIDPPPASALPLLI